MNKNDMFGSLKTFILEQGFGHFFTPFFLKKKEITRDTSIEGDLKITGDDADDFLIEFGKRFNVDMRHFRIGDYFGDEGDWTS